MNLRKKLLFPFGALCALVVFLMGLSIYTINAWNANEKRNNDFLTRSLLVNRVRASTFRAFKNVTASVAGVDPDARRKFQSVIAPARDDLEKWADLAKTDDEQQQVEAVRASFARLTDDANRAFDLTNRGQDGAAARLLEEQLETRSFASFEAATSRAQDSDQRQREQLRARTDRLQGRTRLFLLGSSLSVLVLALLLLAYINGDIFGPLVQVRDKLEEFARGDLSARLEAERADEIGQINDAFNRAVIAAKRRRDDEGEQTSDSSNGPLHDLLAEVREGARHAPDEQSESWQKLLRVAEQLERVAHPLELNLGPTDVRALFYDLLARFGDALAARGASIEISVAPEIESVRLDRQRVREALANALENALETLPERGALVALRARLETEKETTQLVLEIAHNSADDDDERADDDERDDGDNERDSDEKERDDDGNERDEDDERNEDDAKVWGERAAFVVAEEVARAHGGTLQRQRKSEGRYLAMRLPVSK